MVQKHFWWKPLSKYTSIQNGDHKKCKATMEMEISFRKWKFQAFTGRIEIELKCCKRFLFKLIACWLVSSGHVDFLMMNVLNTSNVRCVVLWDWIAYASLLVACVYKTMAYQRTTYTFLQSYMSCDLYPASVCHSIARVRI